jgi:hypothetical protein
MSNNIYICNNFWNKKSSSATTYAALYNFMSLIENICLGPQHTGEIYTVLEYNSRGVFIHMIFQGGSR